MPTLRLDDSSRETITDAFSHVLDRITNNKEFPLKHEDVWDFGMRILDRKVAQSYQYLLDNKAELTTKAMWNPEIVLSNGTWEYGITLFTSSMGLPYDRMPVPVTDLKFNELIEWCDYYEELKKKQKDADSFMRYLIYSCSSVGQIKRVMPADFLTFLPNRMIATFNDAERRSRVPAGYDPQQGQLEHLAQMLALGSISPEKREGMNVSTTRTRISSFDTSIGGV